MACGSCNKRREAKKEPSPSEYEKLFGNYKYLTDRQIKARLDRYKRDFCKGCQLRYDCDISRFFECKGIKIK